MSLMLAGVVATIPASLVAFDPPPATKPAPGSKEKPAPKRKESVARKAFDARDKDGNGRLSETEFVQAAGEADRPLVKRDFHMLDFDRNGFMSFEEFRNVPYLVPLEERGEVPDALADLVAQRFDASLEKWNEFDTNGDGALDQQELRAAGLIGVDVENGNGEIQTWFSLDRDRNGSVSREEWLWQLEVLYGLRRPQGERLRSPSGILIIWGFFKECDRNRDGQVDFSELRQRGLDEAEVNRRIAEMDRNGDRLLTFDEWQTFGPHLVDLFWLTRHFDSNLDGKIDAKELVTNCGDWQQPMARHLIPAFDTDGDGFLSMKEFGLTPLYLQVAPWHAIRTDQDGDHRLSLQEFQFETGTSLKGLTTEYFRRLDTNGDGFLDEGEWEFRIPKPPEIRLFSMTADGKDVELLADVGIFGTTAHGSPDWSPDGSMIVFDSTPAQGADVNYGLTVLVTLAMSGPEKGTLRKIGYGNCPDGSPDGKRVTFFVNGGNPANDAHGVWISNADGTERRLLAAGHWSPRWSRDGKQIVCSDSFRAPKRHILIDVATGEMRPILGLIQAIGVPDVDPTGKRLCVMRHVGNERRL